jgi:cytochrome P450
MRHGFTTVDGPRKILPFLPLPPLPFATSRMSARFPATLNLTTVSAMAVEQGDAPAEGPSVDWLQAQPYADWARARTGACPVIESQLMPGPFSTYQVTRYRDAEHVLRDDKTFSSSINGEHIGQFMGDLILAMGGEEHRKYRNLVAKAFRASQLEQWDETLVRPTINRLIDAIAPLGRADLVAAITSKYPVQVICGIVGVPLEDAEQFAQWAEEINTGPMAPERGHKASQAMVDYLRPLVEARRAEPTGDFLSDLVHAEVDGEQLTDSKLYGFLRLLLPAGGETTFRVMGNALTALLTHPDALARVYADRTLVPEVIEETLRWETSVTMVSRVAAADTEVAGCPIKAGSPVGVITGSANHDESRWDDADAWKLDRPVQHHLAFGTGPHQCLGMHLARLELRVGLNTILDRLPNLRLDPERAEEAVVEGYAFRGPRALPVLFDPS